MKTIGIIQPSFIPWRGFFDFIHEVDQFVFLDDVLWSGGTWRNRNFINTKKGKTLLLTVPVHIHNKPLIKDVRIDNGRNWRHKHLSSIEQNYGNTPYFDRYFSELTDVYEKNDNLISDFDMRLTKLICDWLSLSTDLIVSSTLQTVGTKDEKLISIVKALEGDCYLSGPSARSYIRPELWKNAGLKLRYKDYSGYPIYKQIFEPFENQVSVLDLLFMVGPDAADYIWGRYRQRPTSAAHPTLA